MAYILMAYIVMGDILTTDLVMADIVMADIVMADIGMGKPWLNFFPKIKSAISSPSVQPRRNNQYVGTMGLA